MKSKKGQIAIFVIVAIILVVVIALFFLIDRTPTVQRGQDFDNPESFIDGCIKDVVLNKIDLMLPQGGFVNPTDFIIHENEKVAYLCKNINFYEPCINQHPVYLNVLNNELKTEIENEIGRCFTLLEEELEKRNYDVTADGLEVNTVLKPELVEVKVNREFSMKKGDVVRNFEEFIINVRSPLYELGFVAREIVSQEARLCYFSNDGFMLTYPRYDIKKSSVSDGTKIYSIKDKESENVLNLAIRGCVIPAGF